MIQKPAYRVALIGCGDIAETGHLPALLHHPRFELVALCDIRPDRAALLSGQAGGAESLTDYRTLLSREDIDAAILALHPEHSVDVAIDFLRHKKAVLDEKPLATTLNHGRRLEKVVKSTRGVYQIGFVFRYSPMVQLVAEFSRRIGSPASYSVGIFDERLDRDNRAHFECIQQILRNSSAITHEGSHVIDYFQMWNPSLLERVQAMAVRTEEDFEGPNLWSTQFSAADGSVLNLEIGWFLPALPRSALLILGPNGRLHLDLFAGTGEFAGDGTVEPLRIESLAQNWAGQLDGFAESIDRGKTQTATITDGLRVLVATTACEEAHRLGQAIEIESL